MFLVALVGGWSKYFQFPIFWWRWLVLEHIAHQRLHPVTLSLFNPRQVEWLTSYKWYVHAIATELYFLQFSSSVLTIQKFDANKCGISQQTHVSNIQHLPHNLPPSSPIPQTVIIFLVWKLQYLDDLSSRKTKL